MIKSSDSKAVYANTSLTQSLLLLAQVLLYCQHKTKTIQPVYSYQYTLIYLQTTIIKS